MCLSDDDTKAENIISCLIRVYARSQPSASRAQVKLTLFHPPHCKLGRISFFSSYIKGFESHPSYLFFIPRPLRTLSSWRTICRGTAFPIPNSTNKAHFQRKGLMTMVKRNQYKSSLYVKKSKAPL